MRTNEMLLKVEGPPFVICLPRLVPEIPDTCEEKKSYFSELMFCGSMLRNGFAEIISSLYTFDVITDGRVVGST